MIKFNILVVMLSFNCIPSTNIDLITYTGIQEMN